MERKTEMLSKPFSEGLTEENDVEVKESLLAMQVRFLKHGRKWHVQRIGEAWEPNHILISTRPVKTVDFEYHPRGGESPDSV